MQKSYGQKKVILMFLLPAFIVYTLFVVVSVIWAGYYSLFDWSGVGEKIFLGINNYKQVFTQDRILDDGVTYTCIYRNMCCDPGVWRIAFCDFPVKNHKVQSRTTDTILCAGSNFIGCYLSDFYEIVFCNTNWCY